MTQFLHNLIAFILLMITAKMITKYFTTQEEWEFWEEKIDRLFEKYFHF